MAYRRPAWAIYAIRFNWESVRGAFAIRKGGRVDNFRVLLLDDVMENGSDARRVCAGVVRSGCADRRWFDRRPRRSTRKPRCRTV